MSWVSEMKVAITGTIGSGKSTVLKMLADEGYPCLSADAINKELLEDVNVQDKVVSLLELPSFSKENVRDVIFKDSKKKQALEAFLRPLILNEIQNCNEYKDGIQFVEVPLLFESGWDTYFDYTVVVYVDDEIAKHRLVTYRGMNLDDVNQRIASQMPTLEKLNRCDFSINNNDSAFILKELVNKLLIALRGKNL